MEHLTVENVNLHCRTCLKELKMEKYNLYKLLSFTFLEQCELLKKKKGYPKLLCSKCYDLLQNFERFWQMSLRSTQVLDKLLSSKKTKVHNKRTKKVNCEQNIIKENDSNHIDNTLIEPTVFLESCYSKKCSNLPLKSFEQILFEPSTDAKYETFDKIEDIIPIHKELNIDLEDYPIHSSELVAETTASSSLVDVSETTDLEFCNHKSLQTHQCPVCNRCLSNKFRLRRHMQEYHIENPTLIMCRQEGCGKSFRHHETATSHYRQKHTVIATPALKDTTCVCEDCGRTFKTLANLREHRYQHAPLEARPFQCDECKKGFISKRSYKEHLMRHAGIKNYECPHCGMKKTSIRELRAHINYHTKEKQWRCPHCPRVFNRAANLTMHDKVVHRGIREFDCKYCGQSFGKPDTLKYHIMRHTGEKPHKCEICNRRFIQPTALRTHMKTHTKLKEAD